MKNILKFILLFSIVFSLKSVAQKTGDSKISNKTTFKGKRELRKENRRQQAASGLAVKNERRSRKSNGTGTVNRHDAKSKKVVKERRKSKSKEEKNRDEKERKEKTQPVPAEEKSKG